MAGCEANAPDAAAIRASVASAVARAPRLSGSPGGEWRVVSVCQQGEWAYAFVKGYTAAGAPLASPSLVAVAQHTAAGWHTLLPADAAYDQALAALPSELVPATAQSLLRQAPSTSLAFANPAWVNFSGFALPYPAGQSAYVFWHWYPALDFSIGDPGPGDTIRAAKGGTAVFVKDSSTVECGDPPPNWTCWMYANAIVIQSGPNEYAWYLHLAANTIPGWLHEGVAVPAGADIGQEGMTGWASLPHLHFMVSTWYACCSGEGDGRFPSWPEGATLPVDFNEYAWSQMAYEAVSQNGAPLATEAPPPPPAPAAAPAEATPAPSPNAAAEPSATPAGALQDAAAPRCANPYTVQPGDYLYRIAAQCNVGALALIGANPGLNPNLIYAGQLLNMPVTLGGRPEAAATPDAEQPAAAGVAAPAAASTCAGTHIVAYAETLYQIGAACGLTWQQMAAANGIGYPYTIYAGQALSYP